MADHNAKQPEPVLMRAAIVTALSVLSALLVKTGASDVSSWLSIHSDEVAGALLAVGPAVSAWLARRHVTPLVSPRNAEGDKLVRDAPVFATDALLAANAIYPVAPADVQPAT